MRFHGYLRMCVVVALLLVIGWSAVGCEAREKEMTVHVLVGDPHPVFYVDNPRAQDILRLLKASQRDWKTSIDDAVPLPWYRLGYRGFFVRVAQGSQYVVYDSIELETLLLRLAKPFVADSVLSHIHSEVQRLSTLSLPPARLMPAASVGRNLHCDAPVVGPDNETKYDPDKDDDGCFVSHQGDNNCYDYGCDIATNTFAKPGRGSGRMFTQNTCTDVQQAAERDGLVWFGTTLPKGYPSLGHYVALLIWPDYNFHWIRKDTDTAEHWSHKPGGTPIRNVDNKGDKILDPSQADFSPWTDFCGYMIVVPSNVTIN